MESWSIMKDKTLAIIPARSGSKRLPSKNTKLLLGKPLIEWTIEAALNSSYIDCVLVSTDSNDIRDIAINCGAEAPFLRPEHLSTDQAASVEVIRHASSTFPEYGTITLLQPTSPMRDNYHIDGAFELYNSKKASAVVSITACEHPLEWSNYLSSELNMQYFLESAFKNNDGKKAYRLNGAIYIFPAEKLSSEKFDLYDSYSYGYEMSRPESIDIDTLEDFEYAEYIMRRKLKGINEDYN